MQQECYSGWPSARGAATLVAGGLGAHECGCAAAAYGIHSMCGNGRYPPGSLRVVHWPDSSYRRRSWRFHPRWCLCGFCQQRCARANNQTIFILQVLTVRNLKLSEREAFATVGFRNARISQRKDSDKQRIRNATLSQRQVFAAQRFRNAKISEPKTLCKAFCMPTACLDPHA